MDVRKGAWSSHEDSLLINYITLHGEGRWNYLATNSGLKRSGKSCRLRWKNYLCPNVRLGNFTPQEQLAILKLHSCYGNRWSKIAQCLPGRTDNEIKNFWRTRVQKQAKQLKCDLNSREFSDFIHHTWIPTLMSQQEVNVNYNGPGPLQTGFFTLSPGPHNVNYNGGECAPRPFTPDDQLLLLDYNNNNNNNNNNNIGAYEIHSPARLTTPEELSHMLLTIDHDHYFCFSPSDSNSPHQLI